MWDATISLAITPSLPVKHDLIVGGGVGAKHEVERCSDASSRLTSFSVEGRGSRVVPRSIAGVSIVDAGGPCSR